MTEDKEEGTPLKEINTATSEKDAGTNSESDSKAATDNDSKGNPTITPASSQEISEESPLKVDDSQATPNDAASRLNACNGAGGGSETTETDCFTRRIDTFLGYPCWKQIVIISFIVCFVTFILCIAVILFWPMKLTPSSYPYALQDAYLFYAENLDANVDPCEDFHGFVCRRTIYRFEAEGRTDFDTKKALQENTWKTLVKILSRPASTSDSKMLSEVKVFYESCTKEEEIPNQGVDLLRKLLNNIGGWPFLKKQEDENSRRSDRNWEEVVGRINKAGIASFFPFQLYFDPHPKNASKFSMSLYPYLWDQKGEKKLSADNSTVDYFKLLVSTLQGSIETVKADFDRCVEFETNLHKISNSGKMIVTNSTIANLPSQFPDIDWELFFKNILVDSGVELAETDYVWIADPNYPSQVAKLLKSTTTATIRNYLVFKIVDDAIKMMPSNASDLHAAHLRFHGETKSQSRNFDCVRLLVEKAAAPMGQLYIKNFFSPDTKSVVEEIYEVIKGETEAYFRGINWVGNEAKKIILANLEKLNAIVAYDAEGKKMEKRFFRKLTFHPNGTAYSHYRDLLNFQRSLKLSKLNNISVEDENMLIPLHHATEADALYNHPINTMYVLAAILQQPFFDQDFTLSLNFGGVGFAMAHEVTHGLEILSTCRNSTLCPGWSTGLENCVINAYGNYTVKQIQEMINHDNAKRTLEENLGDLIGLKLAYRAYHNLAQKHKDLEPPLPHLEYTNRQFFWITAANGLCSYKNDTQLKNYMLKDQHSPAEARINVALRNLPEFARDFNCKKGAAMTMTDNCEP